MDIDNVNTILLGFSVTVAFIDIRKIYEHLLQKLVFILI